jgi:hypothetical protein
MPPSTVNVLPVLYEESSVLTVPVSPERLIGAFGCYLANDLR